MSQRKKVAIKNVDEDYIAHHQAFKKERKQYLCSGQWTLRENETCLRFLKANKKLFVDEYVKRGVRPFTKLAATLKMRTPEQCRSHFQKFEVKNDNHIDSIINRLESKIEELKEKAQNKSCERKVKQRKRLSKTKETKEECVPLEKT